MMNVIQGFRCLALLAMHRYPCFPPSLHVLEGLTTGLVRRVSIPAKHAAITIARTAQNLADFGIVDVLASELRALGDSAVLTRNILCSPPGNQSRDSDQLGLRLCCMHDPMSLELHDTCATEKHSWRKVVYETLDGNEALSSPAISTNWVGAGLRSSRLQLLPVRHELRDLCLDREAALRRLERSAYVA